MIFFRLNLKCSICQTFARTQVLCREDIEQYYNTNGNVARQMHYLPSGKITEQGRRETTCTMVV